LFGDFGPEEKIVINGDSLVLEFSEDIFLTEKEFSFQSLNFFYRLESFLEKLRSRDCHFKIVFFDELENLFTCPLKRFLRISTISHLRVNCGEYNVENFENWTSEIFEKWLKDYNPYLVFAHEEYVMIQHFILTCLNKGIYCALISSLDFEIKNIHGWSLQPVSDINFKSIEKHFEISKEESRKIVEEKNKEKNKRMELNCHLF